MIYRLKKIWFALNNQERQYAVFFSIIGGIALCVILWLLFVAITTTAPAPGGSFKEGVVGQPASLNPLLSKNEAEKDLSRLLFSPLSELTESITVSKDGTFWTVRLKENLIWHDKEPITSNDIIFTIEQVQDPSAHAPLFSAFQGVKTERLSERETKVIPAPRTSPFLFESRIANLQIIPQHIFSSIPPHNWLLSEYNLKPIGSGPYKFEKLILQNDGFLESYTLSSFPQGNLSHTPHISTLIVRFFKNRQDAESAFRYGRIDGIGGVDPYEAKAISRPAQTLLYQTNGYYAVFMNQSRNELLRGLSIRRALNNSVPREELTTKVLNNYGRATFGLIPTNGTTTLPDSQSILTALGLTKNDAGKLVETNGQGIEPIELIVPDLPFLENTAEILKASWEKLGFTISIKTLPIETVVNETIPRRDYEMLLFGNIPKPAEDLYPFWHSSQIFHPGLNLSLYKNTQLDNLLNEARATPSSTERMVTLKKVDQILQNDLPAIFLYSPAYVYLTIKQVGGVTPTSSFSSPADRFYDVAEWHLRTKRVLK